MKAPSLLAVLLAGTCLQCSQVPSVAVPVEPLSPRPAEEAESKACVFESRLDPESGVLDLGDGRYLIYSWNMTHWQISSLESQPSSETIDTQGGSSSWLFGNGNFNGLRNGAMDSCGIHGWHTEINLGDAVVAILDEQDDWLGKVEDGFPAKVGVGIAFGVPQRTPSRLFVVPIAGFSFSLKE